MERYYVPKLKGKKGRPLMAGTHSDGMDSSRKTETKRNLSFPVLPDKSPLTIQDFLRDSPLPLRLGRDGRQDAIDLFRALFLPEEYVFAAWHKWMLGELGKTVRTRREWEAVFADIGQPLPICFLPHPVSPVPAPTKHGDKTTFRGEKSIVAFRHLVLELRVPLARQFEVWWRVRHDHLSALLATGGEYLQGFVRVDLPDLPTWNAVIRDKFMPGMSEFRPNLACMRPTFLARLAGAGRALVSREQVRTLPPEMIPPLVRNSLYYVGTELRGGQR